MFTGIIESIGKIAKIEPSGSNIHLWVESNLTPELKIDQSVAHNGVCLTVVEIKDQLYKVTAINETLQKTSLGTWEVDKLINLERGIKLGDRLDGHLVQGHVDTTAECIFTEENNGSWIFSFAYEKNHELMTIEKGSITINGVSLTVVNSKINEFSVAIIPYTYNHTTFNQLKLGDKVNLEFDVIGKYVSKLFLASKV